MSFEASREGPSQAVYSSPLERHETFAHRRMNYGVVFFTISG